MIRLAPLVMGAAALLAATPARASVEEVVAAERAFAALAQEKGVAPAFATYIAEDGLIFIPDPKPGKKLLQSVPSRPGSLRWWPIYAGAAASGDLGFTTGPFVADDGKTKGYGHFFTIWKRQPDGSWRWLIDHGTPTDAQPAEGEATPVTTLAAAKPGGSWTDLRALEARLDQDLARDARAAYLAVLAEDARVMRVGPQPAQGRAAYLARLDAGPRTITASHLDGGASSAGDLAYSYGHASWEQAGKPIKGHYIRVWQHRPAGWRLIVDELIPAPPPPKRTG
jgi:ketosteroid isomerase-like protein